MPKQDTPETIVQPEFVVRVQADGNIELHINGLAPWAVIGICETIKQQMLNLTAPPHNPSVIERAPAGLLDHLPPRH